MSPRHASATREPEKIINNLANIKIAYKIIRCKKCRYFLGVPSQIAGVRLPSIPPTPGGAKPRPEANIL